MWMRKDVPASGCLELAYLNSFFETGLKSPLDEAILAHQHIDVGAWKKIDEVPFDFERRRVSVLIDNGKARWLVVKGAPDEIVGLCTHHTKPRVQGYSAPRRRGAVGDSRSVPRSGRRLSVSWALPGARCHLDHPHAVVGDETELVLAGFAGFLDPPKESAASPALAALKQAGVAIKIVTGDSDLVTRHVCAKLKIPVVGVLTGKEIAQMDDHALRPGWKRPTFSAASIRRRRIA
jgi:Mg2+-importing ATPase